MPHRGAFHSHVVFPAVFCQNVVQRSEIFVNFAAVKHLDVDIFIRLECKGTNLQSALLRFGGSIRGFSAWERLILDPVCNIDVLLTSGNNLFNFFMLLAIFSVVFVLFLGHSLHSSRFYPD